MGNREKLNRREFLKKAPAAMAGLAAAAGLGGNKSGFVRPAAAQGTQAARVSAETEAPKILQYRPLGKTGLELSDISMGAAVDDAVLQYAFDRGINFFDTADSYYGGQGEEALGRAFKSVRDKCIIATKHMVEAGWKKETVKEKVNASLQRLNSDYVDMLFMQGVGDPALFKNEEILNAYEELKQEGKYRFLCFSTHDTDMIVPAAIESGLFSAAMLMYIPGMFPKMEEMHTRLHESGIGIIAMKALRGGERMNILETADPGTTFAQASIQWVLQDKKVSTVLISMRTFEHINEYLQVSGSGPA